MKKVLVLLVVLAAACGKRGDPHPPVPIIPKATTDLTVQQRGSRIVLTWGYPALTTAGQKLATFRRITVYRYAENLPVEQPAKEAGKNILPGDVDTTQPLALQQFSKVPGLSPVQFNRLKQRVDAIEYAKLPEATTGAKLSYEDTPPFHTTDGRPVRLNYAVVTEGQGTRSDVSNVVTIVPLDVPLSPSNVAGALKPEGIVLTWDAPTKSATSDEKPHLIGYDIYRFQHGGTVDDLATPINPAPVTQTTYTDTPPYGAFDYYVTAVVLASPRIESDPSAAATATFKDIQPPPPPKTVNTLVEPKGIRVLWDAVDAPDLAGYKVYRMEGVGHPPTKELGPILFTKEPIKATNFFDPIADPGIEYYYLITSVDKSGNESKPTRGEWVMVPKTP